jgi:hypothetical protein
MITQNWNTKTGDEKVVQLPDDGIFMPINVDDIVTKYNSSNYSIHGMKFPKKMVGNFRSVNDTRNHQVIHVENVPRYIFYKDGKIIGIEE